MACSISQIAEHFDGDFATAFHGATFWRCYNLCMKIFTGDVVPTQYEESSESKFTDEEIKRRVCKFSMQLPPENSLHKWHMEVLFSYDRNFIISLDEIAIILDSSPAKSVFTCFTIAVKTWDAVLHQKEEQKSFSLEKFNKYVLPSHTIIGSNSFLNVFCCFKIKIDNSCQSRDLSVKQIEIYNHHVNYVKVKGEYGKQLHEIALKVGDVEFAAHRCVLVDRSPVIANLYNCPLSGSAAKCVQLRDVNLDTMNYIIGFLYTGEIHTLATDKMTELLKAAEKYAIYDLKKHCECFLISIISGVNVLELLALADEYYASDLKESALKFISANPSIVGDDRKMSLLDNKPHLLREIMKMVLSTFKK